MEILLGRRELKGDFDRKLIQEALTEDVLVYTQPLRVSGAEDGNQHIPNRPVLLPIRPNLSTLRFLPAAVKNHKRNVEAFSAIPDGSRQNFELLPFLATNTDESFLSQINLLHKVGIGSYMDEALSVYNIMHLMKNDVGEEDVPGEYRKTACGFDHNFFACPHPSSVPVEMAFLGEKSDAVIASISSIGDDEAIQGIDAVRAAINSSRFASSERVDEFSDKEVIAYMAASEFQRIAAYVHPWFERVGRTTEEAMGLFMLRSGVRPIFLSTSENRGTREGYERGVANGITAIGFLREAAQRLGLGENEIDGILNTKDFYNRLSNSRFKKAIYKSPLRLVNGPNIFPDSEIMERFYEQVHAINMQLIESFDLTTIVEDPYTIYLTSQLVGRSNPYDSTGRALYEKYTELNDFK